MTTLAILRVTSLLVASTTASTTDDVAKQMQDHSKRMIFFYTSLALLGLFVLGVVIWSTIDDARRGEKRPWWR